MDKKENKPIEKKKKPALRMIHSTSGVKPSHKEPIEKKEKVHKPPEPKEFDEVQNESFETD